MVHTLSSWSMACGIFQIRDQTCVPCTGGGFLATGLPGKPPHFFQKEVDRFEHRICGLNPPSIPPLSTVIFQYQGQDISHPYAQTWNQYFIVASCFLLPNSPFLLQCIILLQEGGPPSQGPKWGSCQTHVLTKQEALLGRGTWADSSRVREHRKTALPQGWQSCFYGDGIMGLTFWAVFGQSL